MPEKDQQDNLCPAGKVLEVEFGAGIRSLKDSARRMEVSCKDVAMSVRQLTEYSIRDKERLDNLEKQHDELKTSKSCIQEVKLKLAKHLGAHEEAKRHEGAEGRKWGASSGIGGAGGLYVVIELFKRFFTSSQ